MTAPPAIAIQATALTKHYGPIRAVDALTLTIPRGQVYGFLGRNGAGKTTTIRMLLGLIRPTAGDVHLLGQPIRPGATEVFRHVGYLVETATAYPNLTVRENLQLQQRLTGAPPAAVAEAIALLHLHEYAGRPAGTLSLGNKQRLSLARALLHSPELLLLDEPANGLDPAAIIDVRELLRGLAHDRGITIFMSSHILTEVALIADRIGIIHAGRLIEELDIAQFHAQATTRLELRVSDPHRAQSLLRDKLNINDIALREGVLYITAPEALAPQIARTIVEAGLGLHALTPVTEDLEAYFMRLTGGQP